MKKDKKTMNFLPGCVRVNTERSEGRTPMIRREQLSFNYIQKEPLSGSDNGMRFYIQKKGDHMLVTLYPEPFCFVKTPPEKKTAREFPNTQEGLDEAVLWMNEQAASYHP